MANLINIQSNQGVKNVSFQIFDKLLHSGRISAKYTKNNKTKWSFNKLINENN